MQPKLNSKKSLVATALLLGMSNASVAEVANLNATASSIAQVAITQTTAMSFGTGVSPAAGSVCNLQATEPAATTVDANNTLDANFFDIVTGDCIDTTGVRSGVYQITGEPGLSYSISFTSGTGVDGDYTFQPNFGCYVDFDGVDNDTDTCSFLPSAGATGVTLPTATDAANAANPGLTAGTAFITVGGRLTNGPTGLNPSQAYSVDFDIVVAYE
jgi:hypothetical protein